MQAQRKEPSGDNPQGDRLESLPEHKLEHSPLTGPQSHTDTNFATPVHDDSGKDAEDAERREVEAEAAEREYRTARRYTGQRVSRSTSRRSSESDSFGDQFTKMVVKELTGTTGRRIVRGILGGLFKGR